MPAIQYQKRGGGFGMVTEGEGTKKLDYKRLVGLVLGPLLFVLLVLLPPLRDPVTGNLMNQTAPWAPNAALGLMLWTIVWWLFEAMPFGVTSLTTAVVACAMIGLSPKAFGYSTAKSGVSATLETFFNPLIWVFFGGFVLGWGMLKSGVAERIARKVTLFSAKISRNAFWTIAGMWFIVWFLSMWMSNTAATAVLFPVLLGILASSPWINDRQAAIAMIFLAYAASIGGIATVIGTPPNLIATAFLSQQGIADIGFVGWLRYGVPVSVVSFIILLIVGKVFFGKAELNLEAVKKAWEEKSIGPMSPEEKWFSVVFGITVFLWIFRGVAKAVGWKIVTQLIPHDAIPAILCAILLFGVPRSLRPYRPFFNWKEGVSAMDWDTLFLFAGGLIMGNMLFKSGAGLWLGKKFVAAGGGSPFLVALAATAITWLITQFASNTASTNMMVPIVISICKAAGFSPHATIGAVVMPAIAASLAFLLPVSTPPNAIVFGSGKIKISDMLRYGLLMSVLTVPVSILILKLTTGL